jgi:hypothetical protein
MESNSKKNIAKRYSRLDLEGLYNDPLIELPHDEFIKQKRKQLDESLTKKKKVYLDLKYWINIRKCIYGEIDNDAIYMKIFNLLKQLVADGKVICPISQNDFFELLKQKYSRTKTAQMIDILSKGVCFNKTYDIKKAELLNLISKEYTNEIKIENYVWNKVINVLGQLNVEFKSNNNNSRINNSIYNFFLEISLQDMVRNDGMYNNDYENEKMLANKLNRIIAKIEEDKSYSLIQSEELYAALYAVAEILELKNDYKFEEFQTINSKDTLNEIIPSLRVLASIHALYRYQKSRKYTENDFDDIEHSSVAIGYCDYFFTEKTYSILLKSKPMNMEKDFCVNIESDPNRVYELLQRID